jgi:hypothetical protein
VKSWTRAGRSTLCGRCGKLVAVGAPVLELRIGTLKRVRPRCEDCAGQAPPDLPPLGDAPPRPAPLTGIMARLGLLPLDDAARDREPGQEG